MQNTLREKVKDALNRFSQGQVPQYYEFMDWVNENSTFKNNPVLPTEEVDYEEFLPAIIIQEYKILKELVENGNNLDLQTFNKFKLTLKFLGAGEDRNLLDVVENDIQYKENFSIKELSVLNKHQIKSLFFESLNHKNSTLASRLVQSIHLLEENLHPGEIEYLEALFHFTDGNFIEALSLARVVKKDQVDYINSSFLVVDSLARLSKLDELLVELKERSEVLDLNKLERIRINLLINMDHEISPVEVGLFEQTFSAFWDYFSEIVQVKQMLDPSIQSFGELKNTIARIRLEISQRFNDLIIRNDKNYQFFTKIFSLDSSEFVAEILKSDPRLASLFVTQISYPDFCEFFLKDQLFDAITYPLFFNSNGLKGYEEVSIYLSALDTFERYEDKLFFLKSNLDALKMGQGEVEFNKFLLEYLYVSMICNDKSAEKDAKKRINRSIKGKEFNSILESSSKKKISSKLTKKSQLAYSSAWWMMEKAKEKDFQWRDAGSISLSFMKVIEIELKTLLIENFLNQSILEQLKQEKLTGKNKKYYTTLDVFIRIVNKQEHSALGKYSYLLQFFEHVVGFASPQTQVILQSLFTKKGLEALRGKQIAKTISYDVINRYRNPPAHIEHLDLPVAEEAGDYVVGTLENYFEWFQIYN